MINQSAVAECKQYLAQCDFDKIFKVQQGLTFLHNNEINIKSRLLESLAQMSNEFFID